MNLKFLIFLYTKIFLILIHSVHTEELGKTEAHSLKEDQCAFKVVMNLLDRLELKDREIKELLVKIAGLEQKEKDFELLHELKNQPIIKLNKPQANLEDLKAESCVPFANSTGIHTIKIPGSDPFDVLCASAATETGWIVIQQRIDGKEDFYRGWAAYRSGFGSFEGDFFLGLEKIHRLTTDRQHQLYIHLERFNGEITYAIYDHFAIAGENDQYNLIIADGFSGNATSNTMNHHKGNFYTFDRDNTYAKFTTKHHAGWWYSGYGNNNLNGKYFDHEVRDDTSIFWDSKYSLKKVQMLIRPKFFYKS